MSPHFTPIVTPRLTPGTFLMYSGKQRDGERFVSIALCLVLELCITDRKLMKILSVYHINLSLLSLSYLVIMIINPTV